MGYDIVQKEFSEAGCRLLTTEEEYVSRKDKLLTRNNLYHFVRFDFLGICGHPSSAVFTNFRNRKTGLYCKGCARQRTSVKHNARENDTGMQCEKQSMELLLGHISDAWECKKTKEGCLADLLVRPKGSTENCWIPIQLKSTYKISYKMYSFRHIVSSYKDMILACHCVSEQLFWVIPYNDLTINGNLNISRRSKYNIYKTDSSALSDTIRLRASECKRCSFEEGMTPITELQQREQKYAQIREECLPFLSFEEIGIAQSKSDFKVGDKRVQEKVGGIIKKKMNFHLATSHGRNEAKRRRFRTYWLGENAYYWFHSSVDSRFWIVPEAILYERKLISKRDEIQKQMHVYICTDKTKDYGTFEWIREYEFDYHALSDADKERIKGFFA